MAPQGATLCVAALGAFLVSPLAQGQITTDGTLGAAGALAGPHYAIPASLGQQSGANLFHSFGVFNLATGESATFSGPSSVANIISRVTGGQASSIDGTIASTIPGANLYLINPRGILFGPNASLDLTGSFHASTADYLKFADGTRFEATPSAAPVLTSAPPAAFGFLGPSAGAIGVQGTTLQPAAGQSISLVGGPVAVTDASVQTTAGDIRVVGMGGAGEVSLDATPTPGTALAPVTIERSTLSTESAGGVPPGHIVIRGGKLSALGANIASTNNEATDAPPVELAASGDLTVSASSVTSQTDWTGRGADLILGGENVTVDHNSQVGSVTVGDGRGGDVKLTAASAARVVAAAEDPDYTNVYSWAFGGGDGGDLLVAGDTVAVQSGNVYSYTGGSGAGGSIGLSGREVSVTNGGWVFTYNWWDTAGRTGDIAIAATSRSFVGGLDWAGNTAFVFTETLGSGRGGALRVAAPSIELTRGMMRTYSFGTGHGGDIGLKGSLVTLEGSLVEVRAEGPGDSGDLLVDAEKVRVHGTPESYAGLSSQVDYYAGGAGGNITVRASDKVEISGDLLEGGIYSGAAYTSTGKNGDVLIESPHVSMSGPGFIYIASNGSADGGSVLIRTHDIELGPGTSIASDAPPWSSARGGDITIDATGRLQLAMEPLPESVPWLEHWHLRPGGSYIVAWTGGPGQAGDVTLNVPEIEAGAESQIVSYTFGPGDSGTVAINADRVKLTDSSAILTSSDNWAGTATGNAGRVVLNIGESFEASGRNSVGPGFVGGFRAAGRGGVLSTATGEGNAGSVYLTAPSVLLDDGRIQTATAAAGDGGQIEIHAGNLTLRNGGQIDAKSSIDSTGDAGSIAIDVANEFDIAGISPIDAAFSGVNAETLGTGEGGNVRISAGTLAIDRGFVRSSTGASGDAGTIDIYAHDILLTDGGWIDAGTAPGSSGAGGSVNLSATGTIAVRGADGGTSITPSLVYENPVLALLFTPGRTQGPFPSTISSGTSGAGPGGNVTLNAPTILIADGGRVTANSTGSGNAGSINIAAPDALRVFGGTISSEALASDGGNIDINVGRLVHLKNGEISTAVGSGSGAGGNITIDPTFVILENSKIAANAFGGSGGNIRIVAEYFLSTPDSLVDASSELGVAGSVQIEAPQTDPSNGLKPLPEQLVDVSALLRETCGTRAAAGDTASSLVDAGRGGLAASPERFAAASYFAPSSTAQAARSGPAGNGLRLHTAHRARFVTCSG